jgi:hypothetical protein
MSQALKEIAAPLLMPTPAQRAWLMRGLGQPGGKLPLFDRNGQRVNPKTGIASDCERAPNGAEPQGRGGGPRGD